MWIAAPVLVVMLGLIVVLATSDPATDRQASSKLLGQQAPAIAGESIDGESFDLATNSGAYVLVNVFATWCTPCIQEHPELVRFQERHAASGDASVVSIVFDDKVENVRRFFDRFGGDWPVLADSDGRISLSYGVSGVPESYLVAPDGTVISKWTGGVTADGIDEVIAESKAAIR